MTWRIIQDDCVAAMAAMPAGSVDAVVCDPPYGLEFMGKDWDAPWKDAARAASATTVEPAGVGGFQDGAGGNAFSRSRVRTDTARHGGDVGTANRGFQAWCEAWAREALRVLKPGGHLLAFGGTRTYHRLAAGIEDAGFEIRDTISWMYGSGFPKSLDVSKAIDKAAGAEREVVGPYPGAGRKPNGSSSAHSVGLGDRVGADMALTAPATPEAAEWEGWGTALKPAHEPIVVARKPLSGTVASTVLQHGTGALNVDGCRIEACGETIDREDEFETTTAAHDGYVRPGASKFTHKPKQRSGPAQIAGRWPANCVFSHHEACDVSSGQRPTIHGWDDGQNLCVPDCPVRLLDEQTGELHSQDPRTRMNGQKATRTPVASPFTAGAEPLAYGDRGGASRFMPTFGHTPEPGHLRFRYQSKASSAERNAGLDTFEEREHGAIAGADRPHEDLDPLSARFASRQRNVHPTVKPIELMRWLVRLVTPPGGTVLDPFAGSGTTGCAATLERLNFVGVERDPDYARIAEARIGWWAQHPDGMDIVKALEGDRARRAVADTGQTSLFDDTPTTDDEEAA